MSHTITSRSDRVLPKGFEALTAMLPPRAINDEVEYDDAIQMLDRLTSVQRLTRGQERYLETLSILIAAYESQRHAIEIDDLPPAEIVRHLLDAHHMNASQLGELLGNRSLGSKILRGERELSKKHIRILAKRFRVNPALFL